MLQTGIENTSGKPKSKRIVAQIDKIKPTAQAGASPDACRYKGYNKCGFLSAAQEAALLFASLPAKERDWL
jgi:hypothetical protein